MEEMLQKNWTQREDRTLGNIRLSGKIKLKEIYDAREVIACDEIQRCLMKSLFLSGLQLTSGRRRIQNPAEVRSASSEKVACMRRTDGSVAR